MLVRGRGPQVLSLDPVDSRKALRLSAEAVELVMTTDDPYEQGQIHEKRAEGTRAGRSPDEARAAPGEAARLFELKGATAAVERARRLLSELPG
jgi:hypothetical protein